MYDCLDGEQIRTFFVPAFDKNRGRGEIVRRGGRHRDFMKGEEVPVRTWWYRYADNMLIIVPDIDDEADAVHFIRDGKYLNTFYTPYIPSNVWKNNDLCVDYDGDLLFVNDAYSLCDYLNDYHQLDKAFFGAREKYKCLFST